MQDAINLAEKIDLLGEAYTLMSARVALRPITATDDDITSAFYGMK